MKILSKKSVVIIFLIDHFFTIQRITKSLV